MKRNSLKEMVSTKNKLLTCSTPEHQADSPSRDSDSICDSDAASPVPFLCTQDGADGEIDVVWNYYTPKSENTTKSRPKDSTPLTHKSKRSLRPKVIQKQLPKRRVKSSQKKTELFQDLIELNKNLHELISSKQSNSLPEKLDSEEDIFDESLENSPKCVPKSSSRCLRKNLLSSNFGRPDTEAALESDDSMNECLLKASQIVEEKILNSEPSAAKKPKFTHKKSNYKTDINFKMDQDSMDAILNSIKLESPVVSKVKKNDTPCINNDSFDSLVGNLNDSVLEQLTQMPLKTDFSETKTNERSKDWTVKELVVHESSPLSKSIFGRHNSMPESPTITNTNKPSTSGMVFGRYNSMPYAHQGKSNNIAPGDSPIRCTPEEIKKKHQLAREKLMAKRLLPFTASQCTQAIQSQVTEKKQIQPKVTRCQNNNENNYIVQEKDNKLDIRNKESEDIKSIIAKKRQEALMKLRRRQPPK